jgi:hypothetical protein
MEAKYKNTHTTIKETLKPGLLSYRIIKQASLKKNDFFFTFLNPQSCPPIAVDEGKVDSLIVNQNAGFGERRLRYCDSRAVIIASFVE